jgi:hypothetical protein
MKLDAAAVTAITVKQNYAKPAYRAPIDRVLASKESEGKLEAEFPGVKPAHVAHMFRQLIKPHEKVSVAKTAKWGVCLIAGK